MTSKTLLQIDELKISTISHTNPITILDTISFQIDQGETVGLVGESGCGKSMTALSIMGLHEPGIMVEGNIFMNGINLLSLNQNTIRTYRGGKISMIFQEPMSSLNPVLSCGKQISESVKLHQTSTNKSVREKVINLFTLVQLPNPDEIFRSYPHELSGGMRQRVMIAMSLAGNPDLLIADEPTTALDVTIQAEIVTLLKKIQEQLGMAILFITHDISLIRQIAVKTLVMYAGQIIEEGPTNELLNFPLHPYTKALLACLPRIDRKKEILPSIPGNVPTPGNYPQGCRFHPRCSVAREDCTFIKPNPIVTGEGRWVRCPYVV